MQLRRDVKRLKEENEVMRKANAPMERFFGLLKTEMVHRTQFSTRREARTALFEYTEISDNRQRRHSSIGYHTPAQARMDMMHKMAAQSKKPLVREQGGSG